MLPTLIRSAAYFIGQVFLKAALDAASKRVLERAVHKAEGSGLRGQDKMRIALDHIKTEGTESLRKSGESHLRTLVEEQLDRLTRS